MSCLLLPEESDETLDDLYVDRKRLLQSGLPEAEFRADLRRALDCSTTVYLGNLSFFTSESQIEAVARLAGPVRRITMGLNRQTSTPAGFCFLEYSTVAAARTARQFLSKNVKIDDRLVKVDPDEGLDPGMDRRWARGFSGGQVCDEYRQSYDKGRGGLGERRAVEAGVASAAAAPHGPCYSWIVPPALKPPPPQSKPPAKQKRARDTFS